MPSHLVPGMMAVFTLVFPAAHGAEPADKAVMTHQAASLKAPSQPSSKSNQAPSSATNATRFHMVPSTSAQQPQKQPPAIDNAVIQQSQPTSRQPAPQQVKLPDAAKPRDIKTSSQRQPRAVEQAPANVGGMVPGQEPDHLAGIRDANQARMFDEARQAADALRDLANTAGAGEGVNPDLGLGGDSGGVDLSGLPGHDVGGFGMPEDSLAMPDLPSNQKGRTGRASAGLRPSTNPKDWASGIAGQDSGGGSGGGMVDWNGQPLEDNDGGAGQLADWNGHIGGSDNGGGGGVVDWDGQPADGNDGGMGNMVDWDGQPLDTSQEAATIRQKEGEAAVIYLKKIEAERGGGGLNETHDMETAGGGGCVEVGAQDCTVEGPRSVDRVNPGRPGGQLQATAPRLTLRKDQLVINPSPEDPGGQSRQVSAEQARMMGEQLREKVKGPGGHPGDAGISPQLEEGSLQGQAQ